MSEHEHPIPQAEQPQPEATDLARLPALWDAIYGAHPGYLALFSGRRTERRLTETRERFFRFPVDGPLAVAWLGREHEEARELYQCGHLLTAPRRRKEAAAPLWSLYADIDQGVVGQAAPAPTVLIESSPGKLQGYWRLTTPVSPVVGEQLNHRLAVTMGADASGWDLTQLLRVPGTHNHKYPDAPLVRVLYSSAACYDPRRFARLLVSVPARPTGLRPRGEAAPPPLTPAAAPPVPLSRPAQAVWEGRDVKLTAAGLVDRSASLVRIARVLYEAGLPPEGMVRALAERDAGLGWEKYSGRRDAWDQYAGITAFVARGARTRRRQG